MDPTVTAQLPHALKRIRLELARSKEFPNGSATHGYEFVAPLDADAHIDGALWQKYREHCRVQRFWGDDECVSELAHKPGGPEHARWVFDYDGASEHGGETGYYFGSHSFRLGEYVSIRDEAHQMHTFRVVFVDSAT
jgi:hypothetical protein